MNKLWSALILTGGTSNRFGSDKSEAIFEGKALIDFLLSSIPAGVAVVIVGPDRDEFPSEILMIQEVPPGGGPVAGIAAGLSLIETEYVAVLATDMPYSAALVPLLLENLFNEVEAAVVVDSEGFQQKVKEVPINTDASRLLLDIDTREDLIKAVADSVRRTRTQSESENS
jgi:molybdopterin-guanine dinucleotide biosynthesis protein A